jgi:hypothetical protein
MERLLDVVFLLALAARVHGLIAESNDSTRLLRIKYPQDGGVAMAPLQLKFHIDAETPEQEFKFQYGGMSICVELQETMAKCSPLIGAKLRFEDLPEGEYVARAYMLEPGTGVHFHDTGPHSFSIVNAADFHVHTIQMIEQTRKAHNFPPELNILQWAEQAQTERAIDSSSPNTTMGSPVFTGASNSGEPLLVIGVKSAVLTNFPRRQAIRQTWASKGALSSSAKVFFLGCMPNMDNIPKDQDRQRFAAAVELEREVYADLLTQELGCEDSHKLLAEKVVAFFEWTVAEFPGAGFVMITDDDVHMRVRELVGDLQGEVRDQRLYIGELIEPLSSAPLVPIRDAAHPYYTSKENYPMGHFIPYAAGPHFLLSMDCVRYVAKNRWRLASLNGQDDTSIAFWLLSIQVHLQITRALISLRSYPCENNVLSVADLSPLGIRIAHDNLLNERELCHGFDYDIWGWQPPGEPTQLLHLG